MDHSREFHVLYVPVEREPGVREAGAVPAPSQLPVRQERHVPRPHWYVGGVGEPHLHF